MFYIKDKIDPDFIIPYWSFTLGMMTFVYERVIVINLGELKDSSICPQGIAITLIKAKGLFICPWTSNPYL
jgi:hypothetical protein